MQSIVSLDPHPLMPALVDDFAETEVRSDDEMRARLSGLTAVESRQGQTLKNSTRCLRRRYISGDVDALASNAAATTRCDPRSNGACKIFVSDKRGF